MSAIQPDTRQRDDRAETAEPRVSASELTGRVAKGDPDALAEMYERWFDRMVGMAMAATSRDEAFCMDAAQDAFVKIIRNPVVLETDAALGAWLRRLVITSAYDRLRAERRRADRESRRLPAHQRDDREQGALVAQLEEAIAALDHEQGDLLIARYRAGWTLARIGERFNLAAGAVDGRIGRLVRRLRGAIEKQDTDGGGG